MLLGSSPCGLGRHYSASTLFDSVWAVRRQPDLFYDWLQG